MPYTANANIAKIQVTNTFDEWRVATNSLIEDRNLLRHYDYVKDDDNLTLANGAIFIRRTLSGVTFTNENDAEIGGKTTSNTVHITNGIDSLLVDGNTYLSGINSTLYANNDVQIKGNTSGNGFLTISGYRRDAQNNIMNVNSTFYMANSGNLIQNQSFLAEKLITANLAGNFVGLKVKANAEIDGNATISIDTKVGANLYVLKEGTVSGNLIVSKNTAISGNAIISQNTIISGNTGIGTTAPVTKVEVAGTTGTNSANLTQSFFDASATGAAHTFRHSRGATLGTLGLVSSGDDLGTIQFQGANTTMFQTTAAIVSQVDDTTTATSNVSGRLIFKTRGTTGIETERLRLDSDGNFGVGVTPGYKLHVDGGSNITTAYTSSSTTLASPNVVAGFDYRGATVAMPAIIRFYDAPTSSLWYFGNGGGDTSLSAPLVFGNRTGGVAYSERMRIDSTGDVGIGEISPNSKLHVSSSSDMAYFGEGETGAGIYFKNRLAALPTSGTNATIAWLESTSGYTAGSLLLGSRPATGQVVLSASGGGDLVVTATGKVGIGTSSFASSAKFQVAGGRSYFGSNDSVYAIHAAYNNTRALAGQGYYLGATDSTTPSLVFSNNDGTERARIDSAGNLSVGTTISTALLTAKSNSATTAAVVSVINAWAGSSGTVANGFGASFQFTLEDAGGNDIYTNSIRSEWVNAASGTRTAKLVFTSAAGNAQTDAMTIDSSGNVGIGTSSPAAKLDIDGSTALAIQASLTSGADNNFHLYAVNGATGSAAGTEVARFGVGYGGNASTSFSSGFSFIRGSSTTDGALAILTNASERMRITSGGRVGIGSTGPVAALQVGGSLGSSNVGMGPLGDLTNMSNPRGYYGINCNYDDSTSNFKLTSDGTNNGGSAIWGNVGGHVYIAAIPSTGASTQTLTSTQFAANVRMTILSSGYVGIGMTPTTNFEVAGSAKIGTNLTVVGTGSFGGDVTLSKGATIAGNVAVSQNTSTGNLAVTSNTTTGFITVSSNTSTGNLTVSQVMNVATGNITSLWVKSLKVQDPIQGNATIDADTFKLRASQSTDGDGYFAVGRGDTIGGTFAALKFDYASNTWMMTANTAQTGGGYTTLATSKTTEATANYIPKTSTGQKLINSMMYDNGSSIGIGTNGPATKLEVYGSHTDTKLRLYSTGNTAGADASLDMWASEPGWTYNGSGIGGNINGNPSGGRRNTAYGSSMIRFINGLTHFHNSSGAPSNNPSITIDASGSLGIGTSSPAAKLHISNGSDADSGQFTAITIGSSTATNARTASFVKNTSAPYDLTIVSQNYTQATTGSLIFKNGATEHMRLTSSGGLLVGTTTATGKISVSADTLGTAAGSTVEYMRFTSTNTSDNQLRFIHGRDGTGGSNWTSAYTRIQVTTDTTNQGYIQFNGTGNQYGISFGTLNSEKMRMDSLGQLGLATIPDTKLHLNSTTTQALKISGDTGYQLILFGNKDSGGVDRPSSIAASDGNLYFGYGSTWTGNGGTLTHNMILDSYGNLGIGATPSGSYKLQVNGAFAATTKSFVIDHPTKEGMKLRYGSLEGPENGVYVRGRLKGSKKIELPDYWTALVDEESITVQLTPIGNHQKIYVKSIENNTVYVEAEGMFSSVDCFYVVFAERKDVDKLLVEF